MGVHLVWDAIRNCATKRREVSVYCGFQRESRFLFGGIGRVGAWAAWGELDKPEGSTRRQSTTEGKGNDIRQKGELRAAVESEPPIPGFAAEQWE